MGFYSNVILPRLLDWSMSDPRMAEQRQALLAEVEGNVLEIGFGTGLNLPHYPDTVQQITTVDPNPGMNKQAQKRIQETQIQVDSRVLNGEKLPMSDGSFDCVVSTWTLCSIAKVEQALGEIYRVLKPGGRFFFIEHGLSDDPKLQTWQHRLTPLQKVIADGCHLDREIQKLVEAQFDQVQLERFNLESLPAIVGYTYKGIATKVG